MCEPSSQTAASILCPFPLREIQSGDDSPVKTPEWLTQFGFVGGNAHALALASVGEHYVKCCYPGVEAGQIQDLVDFATWISLLDDFVEKGPLSINLSGMTHFLKSVGYICEAPNYLRSADLGFDRDNRLAEVIIDVKSRISAWTSYEQIRNLMFATSHFISGLVWESAYTNMRKTPDLNTYCAIRMENSGVYIAHAIAECVNNVELTQAERSSPGIQALTQCILFVLALDNDIYSHHKEKNDGAAFPSVIDILMYSHRSQDPDLAFMDAIELRNRCMLCYLKLKDKLKHTIGNRLDMYSKGLEDIISGNLIFGSTCARYAAPKSPQFLGETNALYVRPDSIQVPVVDTLDIPMSVPRHIPSIAWWWKLLE